MLITDRECRRGGERFAVPTLGEVEGKLLVSEVVATSCLRQLFAGPEIDPLASIRRRTKQALQNRCTKVGLCCEDTDAAVDYAFQLLDAAVEAVANHPKPNFKRSETVHRSSRMVASKQ
jgi:hypothetical protein